MGERRTVWVIEQGNYSDYRVVGVYSTKEAAERIAAKINEGRPYDEAEVAEWVLDPGVDALNEGLDPFTIVMARDGTVERVDRREWSSYDLSGGLQIWPRTKAPAYKGSGVPDALHGVVYATDVEHAVKIANERRTQMIASGEWAA